MAYLDLQDQQPVTPDAEAESRRKMLMMLAGSLGKPSILGNRPEPSPVINESQPTIPPPRLTPTAPPSIADTIVTPTATRLGIPAAQPVRPNVQPMRSDFEAKQELGGWKKVLGLTAGFGLGSAPLVNQVLHGQANKANQQFAQATQDWERGQSDAARAATTDEALARAESLRNPKQDKPETLDREAYDFYIGQGMSPAAARKQVLADAQEQKPDKTLSFDEAAYQEWLPTHKGGTRLQFMKEKAAATDKPQKPERTLITVPQSDGSSKVVEATPGMVIPKGARTVTQMGKEAEPSADEQRRADLGKNLNENLAAYEDIVRRRPDLFGPVAGRKTAAKMMIGSSDPDISALRSIKEFAGMAAVGTHAMRNAQHVKIASDAMMNLNDQPEAILAENGPLSRARTSIKTFIGDVEGERVQDQAKHGKDIQWHIENGQLIQGPPKK